MARIFLHPSGRAIRLLYPVTLIGVIALGLSACTAKPVDEQRTDSPSADARVQDRVMNGRVQERVAAVISLAGAVGGSALADGASQSLVNMLQYIPGSDCDSSDEGALESLKPAVRQHWLAANPLPESIRYYSLVTYPDREHISSGLMPSYNRLSRIDARNDSQLIFYDQIIPGSTLLGYLNADHWAAAVPIARSNALLGATFVNKNGFPREVMLEAIARYVEEDLATRR